MVVPAPRPSVRRPPLKEHSSRPELKTSCHASTAFHDAAGRGAGGLKDVANAASCDGAADGEGAFRMSKALMGHVGQPSAYMLLRELVALKARVTELEKALAVAEREMIELRGDTDLTSRTKQAALA